MLTNLRRLPEVGEQITNCVLAVTNGMHHQYCPCSCHSALHIHTISRPHMEQLIIGSISQDEVVELKEAVAAMADALEAFINTPIGALEYHHPYYQYGNAVAVLGLPWYLDCVRRWGIHLIYFGGPPNKGSYPDN